MSLDGRVVVRGGPSGSRICKRALAAVDFVGGATEDGPAGVEELIAGVLPSLRLICYELR